MDPPRSSVSFSGRLAHIKRETRSRTWLRILLGTAYLVAGASVPIIFSADPGHNIRWGVLLFSLGLIPGLLFTVLLVTRLRLDYLRLLLPWYGIPYFAWLIGAPPKREGSPATLAYALGLFGTIVFIATVFATTRP